MDSAATNRCTTDTELAWARIVERLTSEQHSGDGRSHNPGHGDPERGFSSRFNRRVLTIAATVAMALAASGWLLSTMANANGGSGAGSTVDPAGEPVSLPAAPPGWVLPVIAIAGLALVLAVHRGIARRLITMGTALIVSGVVTATALALPAIRTGAELAANAPAIEGYELQWATIDRWPDRHTRILAELGYAPIDLVPTGPNGEARAAVEALADDLDLPYSEPSALGHRTAPRCLTNNRASVDREFPFGDVYCLDSFRQGTLIVTAHGHVPGGFLLPRIIGFGLVGFGLIFLAVAATGDWFGSGPRRRGRGWLAAALCAFSVALYLVGLTAFDVIRVGPLGMVPDRCWPGAGVPIVECRDIVYGELEERSAQYSGLRIYGPAVFVSDAVAAIFVAVGWLAGLVGGMNRRRSIVLAGLTVLVAVIGIGAQLAYSETISVMGNLND